MASLFPILRFFDNKGAVLASGKVYTFAIGSSTPKTAYTSQTGGTALSNPIILDAYGVPATSGSIWLAASGGYKIYVTDSNGVLISAFDGMGNWLNSTTDWATLTATVAQLNTFHSSVSSPGTVYASSNVIVDASKNVSTFNNLTSATLVATTGLSTPILKDANASPAVTVSTTTSQVNAITLTPAATGNSPALTASGTDTNIDLKLLAKGTGYVKASGISYPITDGTTGQRVTTNGSGVVTFSTTPQSLYNTTFSETALSYLDGTALLTTISVTPTSATSTISFTAILNSMTSTSAYTNLIWFVAGGQASSTPPTAVAQRAAISANGHTQLSLQYILPSWGTSALTFKVYRSGGLAATNGGANNATRQYNGVSNTRIIVREYK